MAQKIQKTNVCRLLDAAGIAYELIEYEVDDSDLSATHMAEQLGEELRLAPQDRINYVPLEVSDLI